MDVQNSSDALETGDTDRATNECDICLKSDNHNIADKYCFVCVEYLCQACFKDHMSFKITREHKISNIDELVVPTELCEPCKYRSRDRKATNFCKDCAEFLCSDCRFKHQQMKIAKHHSVILAIDKFRQEIKMKRYCGICMEDNEKNEAVALCLDCNPQEILCSECVTEHVAFRKTRGHRIEHSLAKYRGADVTISKGISSELNISEGLEKPSENQPGKPTLDGVTKADTIQLRWQHPRRLYEEHQYQIRYKTTSPSDTWKFYHETFLECAVVLEKLKSDSTFIFQVRMVNNDKEGPYSSQSDPIHTKQSAAIRLIHHSTKLQNSESIPTIIKLTLEENMQARNTGANTRKFLLGSPNLTICKEKTIMLVGAMGSGKSTLVDGIINYILGVNWDDPFRFTVVDLEEERNVLNYQALSKSLWITTYCINPVDGSRLDYRLNIIDTPGFGDTWGIERDQQINEQIRKLFSASDATGVFYLDSVCFITRAPDARLTPTQNYTFNAILSLFGKDIADNIQILITFADGKTPPVLSALKEAKLPHEIYFPFDNVSLFENNRGPNMSPLSPMFWEMAYNSFKTFFEHLKTMQTKSLKQTKEVLLKRQEMKTTTENLTPLVSASLNKLDELKAELRIIEQHKTEIEANENQIKKALPIGQHVPYKFDYETVKLTKKYSETEDKYRKAGGEKMTHENVVQCMMDEIIVLQTDILNGMNVVTECNNVLKEIALRPNPLNAKEHIDLLIASEKREKHEGFQRRIESLMECRRMCMIEDDVKRLQTDIQRYMSHTKFKVENREQKKKLFLGKLFSIQPWNK